MNNPNSLDNSHSSSSDSHEPEVRQEQRALALLPTNYSFELTEEFHDAFGSDSLLPLPASYRLASWRKHVGDPELQRLKEEAAEYNREAEEEYAKKVAEIEAENAKRKERNQEWWVAYQNARNGYASRVVQWEKDTKRFNDKLERDVISQARVNLDIVLLRQAQTIREAVKQVAKITLHQRSELEFTLYNPLWIKFAENLNRYNQCDANFKSLALRAGVTKLYVFVPHGEGIEDCGDHYRVRFPLYFPDAKPHKLLPTIEKWFPFGAFFARDAFQTPPSSRGMLDGIMHALFRSNDEAKLVATIDEKVLSRESERTRREKYLEVLNKESLNSEVIAYLTQSHPDSKRGPSKPDVARLYAVEMLPAPNLPSLKVPIPPEPPAYCFDTPEKDNIEHVFKGSQVYSIEQVTTLARTQLFAEDRLRPYFMLGGVPFPISGGSPHMLIVGTSGSGKTTTLLRLMSSLLPLSRAQAERLAERVCNGNTPYPKSSHQWGRSLTHQAVVNGARIVQRPANGDGA